MNYLSKRKDKFSFFSIILAYMVMMLILPANICLAAFTLTAQPYGGGFDIRFGRVAADDPKQAQEVTIRVTSTIGKQYQVYQRIDQPLQTADGVELDVEQFRMFTLINSNAQGTLERIEEYPLLFSDSVIYTSNRAGDGDSFKVVYTLTPALNQTPGTYYGRIMYILRPIDSSQEQVIETINIYAELSNDGSVEITTNTGFNRLRLSSKDVGRVEQGRYPQVKISVKGNMGSAYRIYQKLIDTQLKSERGETFNLSKVAFETVSARDAQLVNQGDLSLLRSKTLIYASDAQGSAADVIVRYAPTDDFIQQEAGYYTGSIAYYLEVDRSRTFVEPGLISEVDFEFEVDPVFRIVALSVTPEGEVQREGSMLLAFGDIGYKTGTKESTVRITVESNLGEPYQVTQKFPELLENEKGDSISQELFTFTMEKTEATKGKVKFEEKTAIKPDVDVPVFVSDAQGNSDEFDIMYSLKVEPDTRAGDYTTQVSYSLSEL